MLNKSALTSWVVGGLAVLLLLLPPLLTAIVWTTLNLFITAFSLAATVAMALFAPKAKWIFASISAGIVAFPPYPNWIFWSEDEGWKFWIGPSVRSLEIGANLVFFVVAFLPILALFWAIDLGKRRRT